MYADICKGDINHLFITTQSSSSPCTWILNIIQVPIRCQQWIREELHSGLKRTTRPFIVFQTDNSKSPTYSVTNWGSVVSGNWENESGATESFLASPPHLSNPLISKLPGSWLVISCLQQKHTEHAVDTGSSPILFAISSLCIIVADHWRYHQNNILWTTIFPVS